jgi:nuclease-like protein
MFAASVTRARRQQYRHLGRSAGYGLSATLILLVALGAARNGQSAFPIIALLLLGAVLCWVARRSHGIAGRWRVGAEPERAVQVALRGLPREGWAVRNGVRWRGAGDIDHLVRSPDGVGFAIETKTRTFREEHLRRTAATARSAARRRRRYPRGVVPVLCDVRANRVEYRLGPWWWCRSMAGSEAPSHGSCPQLSHPTDRGRVGGQWVGRPVADGPGPVWRGLRSGDRAPHHQRQPRRDRRRAADCRC